MANAKNNTPLNVNINTFLAQMFLMEATLSIFLAILANSNRGFYALKNKHKMPQPLETVTLRKR